MPNVVLLAVVGYAIHSSHLKHTSYSILLLIRATSLNSTYDNNDPFLKWSYPYLTLRFFSAFSLVVHYRVISYYSLNLSLYLGQ